MGAKKYVMAFAVSLYMFMAGNVVLWHTVTRNHFMGRDLERMGSFEIHEAEERDTVFTGQHTEFTEYIKSGLKESFDIITIGDSFTNGGGGNYYQDYLAGEYGLKILNFAQKGNCLEDLYILIASGLIDEISPRCVILESVERLVQSRLGNEIISPAPAARDDVIRRALAKTQGTQSSEGYLPPVMMKANMSFLRNKLYHILRPERLSSAVYITELDREMFTNKGQENILLYYHEDMNFTSRPLNPGIFARNLSNAARILRDKGITLIFFAAPDKYDLYYPYISDKSGRPASNFFTAMMSARHEGCTVMDSLKILRNALERGEKDVYWLDDTHWSYKGITIFCDELVKYLPAPKLNKTR